MFMLAVGMSNSRVTIMCFLRAQRFEGRVCSRCHGECRVVRDGAAEVQSDSAACREVPFRDWTVETGVGLA
jgi:hypothetical protein